ncbi:MAG: uncharacterized protein JWN48_4664 [Myxococcaceae bacterium]|nr:uncharacterized protein [Myxococcaceae bacterium]
MIARLFLAPRVAPSLLCAAAALPFAGLASPAAAQSLEDCGNIYVQAQGTCEYDPPSIDCNVACQPIHLQAACAGEAYVDCRGSCNANIDVGCDVDCQASCTAKCNVDPGSFDCQAYCQADCAGSCDAECSASADKAHCQASCKASCSGDCAANCKIRPPMVDCRADCQASCTGSCHAKANVGCQVMCQSKFNVKCEAELSGGCEAQCKSEQGALFCEGDYVDSRNNLDQCIEALKNDLNVKVEGYAEGECANNTCSGKVGGGASCSAVPSRQAGRSGSAWLAIVGALGALVWRRRR